MENPLGKRGLRQLREGESKNWNLKYQSVFLSTKYSQMGSSALFFCFKMKKKISKLFMMTNTWASRPSFNGPLLSYDEAHKQVKFITFFVLEKEKRKELT